MYYCEKDQAWFEDNGTFIVYKRDLNFNGQTIHQYLQDKVRPDTDLKTLLDFMRDNDGALFYDKDKDAFYLATHNNNAHQRILSVGATYTAWHPKEEPCDNGEPFASESIRLSIQSLNKLETAQHGDKTDLPKGD